MKNNSLLRRLAAALLCLAFVIPCAPHALAQAEIKYQSYAESLAPLGVFIGTGSDFELGRQPTRIEGLVVLIRLLGVENDAQAMAGAAMPFTDVPVWASGYAAYAYENGLTQGISATQFGSSNTLEAKMFCTFLLRSLGYSDKTGDFDYNSAVEFAYAIGLLQQEQNSEIASGVFLRDQMAKLSWDALFFPVKGNNISLLNKLVADGKIDSAKAAAFAATKAVSSDPADKSLTELAGLAASVVKLDCRYGTGSGVILSADGLIITNYHVIKGEPWVKVVFDDGTVYDGDVYVQDYSVALDLAVIKIDKAGLVPVAIGDSDTLKRGERIVTIGSPKGYLNTIAEGIVSGFNNVLGVDSIQISAAISSGSSGGALFDMKGNLVGITFAAERDGENLGFAIPSNRISELDQTKMLTLEQFAAAHYVQYKPATTPKAYSSASFVPDFGSMYGIEPVESLHEDGYHLYSYEGITLEHIDEYEAILESWGYKYSIELTNIALNEAFYSNPAVFIDNRNDKLVIIDAYYYGDILVMIVAFEA